LNLTTITIFSLIMPPPPRSTLFPYTTLFRSVCGDVGYGKTEVAMRAAFKAIGDGKQVAVLTPTTVLCYQHYETFKERFAAFPVRSEEHTSELQSLAYLVCRLLLEKKKNQ